MNEISTTEKPVESAYGSPTREERTIDPTAPNPWKVAWREARILILAVIAIVLEGNQR